MKNKNLVFIVLLIIVLLITFVIIKEIIPIIKEKDSKNREKYLKLSEESTTSSILL